MRPGNDLDGGDSVPRTIDPEATTVLQAPSRRDPSRPEASQREPARLARGTNLLSVHREDTAPCCIVTTDGGPSYEESVKKLADS